MPIPIPQPDVFSITPTINARMAGLQSRYQREDRETAAEERMTQAIAQMAYGANTPERWTQMLGALQRRFPQADLSSFQDFSSREMAIGQGLSLEGQINRDFNERGWAQGQEDRATAEAQRNALTQGLTGLVDGQPVPTVDPNNPSWMVRGSGATGTNTPPEIVYNNQNAIRNDPITGQLSNAIQAAAAEAGIDRIVVVSGGQEAEGEGGARTGEVRHDHGNAADVELYVGDRLLDFTNPQDLAIYQRFVTAAASNGVTGIGAGSDYMGNTRIHVGFGAPAVWGADGAGANAPEWLRTAYNAASRERSGGVPLTDQQRTLVHALIDGGQIDGALQIITQAMAPPPPQDPFTLGEGDVRYGPNGQIIASNVPAVTGGGDPFTLGDGQIRYDAAGNIIAQNATDPPRPGARFGPIITGANAAAVNLDPNLRYQQNLDTLAYEVVGPTGQHIEVVNEAENARGNVVNTMFDDILTEGRQAMGQLAEIGRLEDLLTTTGGGIGPALQRFAGTLGIEIGENVGEIQAAQALISRLVPQQRVPGSGVTTDFDARMFIASLPQIINTEEGNALIIETMRGLTQFKADQARIALRYLSEEVNPATNQPWTASESLQALFALPDPFEAFKASQAQPPPTASPPAIRSGNQATAPNLAAPAGTPAAVTQPQTGPRPTAPASSSLNTLLQRAAEREGITPVEGQTVTVDGRPYVFHDNAWWQAQ